MITGPRLARLFELKSNPTAKFHGMRLALAALGLLSAFPFTGCQVPPPATPITQADSKLDVLTLRESDVLKIAFPGAPNLDTTQTVRRDGRITMPVIGEVVAAGLTPAALEQQLASQYASQLVSKEVTVTVVSSSFSVFVSGSVVRPGKVTVDHPLSVLEAVMEAGGFDNAKADIRAIVVTRQEGGQYKNFIVDLKVVLEGKQTDPFYLKPSDVVYVPEKITWF